jgi:broad specificity phosphatase PhoE
MTGYSGRYVGARDVPLSPEGCRQIAGLRSVLPEQKIKKIVASPMLRCRQSNEILFPDHVVFYDEDLCEIDFGKWEGLTFQEIVTEDSELVDEWAEWSPEFCFPEGECIGHFVDRVYSTGARIAAFSEENVMVIAHGGVIRTLLCYFLKLDPSDYLLFQVKKGRFATLELYSEGAVLTGLNLGGR